MDIIKLRVVTPQKAEGPIECDSVHLQITDDLDGNGGGDYGIRLGHIRSVISVDKGNVTAYLDGKQVFETKVDGGFATVENNTITVVAEKTFS